MTQITVETKFSPDIIEQFVGYPDGLSPVLAQVLRLKDDGVRQALIALGWTPPELSRLRSSLSRVEAERDALRRFVDIEADTLEEQGFSADADRFRETLADLTTRFAPAPTEGEKP